MSIIANFDDIVPVNVTSLNGAESQAGQVIGPAYGAFGNGVSNSVIGFSTMRLDDHVIDPTVKTKLSALVRLPFLGANSGGNTGFVIGSLGIVNTAATNNNAGFLLSALMDGRNGTSSGTSMMFQVRAQNMGTTNVLYTDTNLGNWVKPNQFYRIEITVEPIAGNTTQILCTIEWIDHGTNVVIKSTQHTRPIIADMRPHYAVYDRAHIDSIQLQVGDEPYLSNVPVRVRIGNQWVKKTMKKSKGGIFVPAYPRVQKNGQNIW